MKNREFKTLIALVLTLTLSAGALGINPATVYAAETASKTESTATPGAAAGSSLKPYKDETVYAKVNGSGSVTSVTVSDQLKNIADIKSIEDISDLTNIENVKGDETFSQQNQKLTWAGSNKDICYQGTTTETLPVGVKISYTLDGKPVTAEELKGKSGHLVIRYEYQNTTESTGAYTPFLMVTGIILDNSMFTNVQLSNGKLVSDGDRDVAIGMGLPGLSTALGVSDLDIPDSFELEADVTDYEAVEGITVATNELFNSLDTEKFDSLSDLEGAMSSLQSAADQLVDGSGQLKDGLHTLLESSGTMVDGIGQLADGSSELKTGTSSLLTGSSALTDGSKTLAEGTTQLAAGATELNQGAAQVAGGAQEASSKVSSLLLPGIGQLNNGVADMQGKVGVGINALLAGTDALQTGVQTAASTAAVIDAGVDQAAAGAKALSDGLGTASTSAAQLSSATNGLARTLAQQQLPVSKTVTVDNSDIYNQLTALLATMETDADKAAVQQLLDSFEQTKQVQIGDTLTLDPTLAGTAQTIADNLSALSSVLGTNGEKTLGTGAASLYNTLSNTNEPTIKAGTSGLSNALGATGENTLQGGIAQLQYGLNNMELQLCDGTTQLLYGLGILQDGTQTLNDGLGSLSAGASQVSSGASALDKNMQTANAGALFLSQGASELNIGALALNDGAETLNNGLSTLQSGSDELINGVTQLDEGATKLNEGMIQFNEEGIQKLVSVFNGDIDALLNNMNSLLDASKNYKNFSGISDNMDGEVKFIFITEK